MTATAAEALEVALWLHRAPARRAALLGRPLPDGVGQLLRVAGGAPDQVAAAARITGEDEATILEAVRFYLQQVLFHEEADAYRVLGLRPDAPQEQAREHHRLLQQWLHPDRRGNDDWESVYATRINRAWSHLRTPQARATYDASLSEAPGRSRLSGDHQVPARPVPPTIAQPTHTRTRNLTFLVLLGCMGLLVLIALRQERPPEWQESRPPLVDVQPTAEPELVEAQIATLGASLVDATEGAMTSVMNDPAPSPGPAKVTPPAVAAPVVAMPLAAPLAASPARAVATTRAAPEPVARLAPRRPQPAAVEPPDPDLEPPAPVPVPRAPAVPEAPAETILVAAAEPVRTPPANSVPLEVIPDALERMNEARRRADLVLAYFADRTGGLPPVWNDVSTLREAERIHAALHERLGAPRRVRVELRDPRWSLTPDGASLASRYRTANEQGRVGIEFTWREGQLLVRAISLVPDA